MGCACHKAVSFNDYFEQGQDETDSPFLKPSSRKWAEKLPLRSSILAAFLLIVAFTCSFFPLYAPLSAFFLLFVYFLAGIPSIIESIEDLNNWDVNIDVLMTLAAFSSVLIGSSMEGALLLVLFSLSHAMEDAVTSKAKDAISGLRKLSPTTATLILEKGRLIQRATQDIKKGDTILVKSGEVVALDGTIIEGASSVNLVHLTGENFPITKNVGDEVPAGARNLEGTLTITVTRSSADSTLAKIIEMVTNAQEAKPKLQRWFDALSRRYALTIISLSLLFALSFPYLFGIPFLGKEGSLYRSLAFLIAASPCALIIAIPIAYLSAIGSCAKKGILIKGGITLDALATCRAIAFDKTGTLTTGELKVDDILSEDPKKATALTYALERGAIHPIAKALIAYAESKDISATPIDQLRALPGEGIEAMHQGEAIALGSPDFIIKKLSKEAALALTAITKEQKEKGKLLAVLYAENKTHVFILSDTLRPRMKETVQQLESKNYHVVMLTGDHEENARRTAAEVAIKNFYYDLKPDDKLKHVETLAQKYGLAMIGDGINDAPALARATVGICMGQVGNNATMDAADIVLLHDNIDHLEWLLKKGKKTAAVVRENLFLAAAAILIATTPALAGWIPLWLAVLLHEGGTVLVGLNGLRLLQVDSKQKTSR